MQIFHFSDTHLWIWLENTPRESDFYKNFETTINQILQNKPDIVIHSWDLFHTSKPSNKAISVVVENFLKLEKAGIKVIVIAWNHDTPRLSVTTHPFEIFQSMEWFSIFFEPKIQSTEIKNINFVVLPHIHDEVVFKQEFAKVHSQIQEWKTNIFISHFGISAVEYDEYTDEISGVNITLDELKILKQFDYVALWHYHKQFCIGKICYPGSIEHTSFNQKDYKIWYNIFDTDTKKVESFQLETRKMIDLGIIDCWEIFTTQDLLLFLEKKIDKNILKQAIVKIVLENMSTKLLLEFDEKQFFDFFQNAFYFEYKKIKFISEKHSWTHISESSNIIFDNFENFFQSYPFWSDINENQKQEIKNELTNFLK